ncbi:golgin subfamily A member 6-like protein 1 [Gambusia affinis]|uniref:golgin subfamily A member 6-like protein 1 n=1 Tax=Gambusia affinis TaxID=33528 RepID=UPI001CDD4E53|nr:golgin subfamily A member 6-like protein 1 [Gambusia affinis]
MSHYSPRFNSGSMGSHWRRGGQQNPPGRFPPAHPTVFHGEIERLNYLLEMERAGRDQKLSHLEAELEETKLQLKKQKDLKETFINQAKEAKRELERLEKFSDPAVLNAAVTASKVHSEVKHMNKKSLQQDFEELKVAHLLSREAFVAEIQAERKKSAALQEQLDQLQTSFQELSSKHEADDALLRKEEETQKIHEERLHEEQQLLENLRAEKDKMFQEMSQKIKFLQDSEKHLQEELVQLRRSYEELNGKYERYQEELRDEKDANTEREKENLQLIKDLRADKEELSQKLSGEITIRQKREKLMLHELDQVHGSYEELKCKYEKDIMEIQQQVETCEMKIKQEEIARSNREQKENIIHERKLSAMQQLQKLQQQIKEERKVHLKKREEDKMSLDKLRAEKEELLQTMSEEITILQNREKQNLQELDQVQVSNQELKSRFETEIMNLQLEVETHQQQLKEERKDHLKKTEEDKMVLDKLRAEYAILQENTKTEIKFLQEKERSIQAELDEVNSLYQDLNCRYETDVTAIKHQAETYQQEISFLKNDLETARKDLMLADSLRAEETEENSGNQEHLVKVSSPEVSAEEELSGEPLSGCSSESPEETKVSAETVLEDLNHPDTETMKDGKKKKSRISFWKKVRNTLWWKKPKKKQNREEHQEQA